jgi:TetR/AcrR family transcriptional regulator, cholesterol catabolism regulator
VARRTPPRQHLNKPRDSILEVATGLFSESGYAGTTIRDIAKGVGVLPGSLYAHIDNKETLLLEIAETGIDRFLAVTDAIDRSVEPAERMRLAIKAHLAVVAENPSRTLVVFHQWRYLTGPNRARIVDKRQRYEDFYRALVRDGMASGDFGAGLDPKIAVLSLLGALNWTAEWFKPDGPADAEEIGDRVADTLLWGILGK